MTAAKAVSIEIFQKKLDQLKKFQCPCPMKESELGVIDNFTQNFSASDIQFAKTTLVQEFKEKDSLSWVVGSALELFKVRYRGQWTINIVPSGVECAMQGTAAFTKRVILQMTQNGQRYII